MAQRLATEYVKTCLQLTEAEMLKFFQMFVDHGVTLQVKILENGNQEVVFQDGEGQEITLSFEKKSGLYECTGSCRLSNTLLANLMRKAVADFKGSAKVNRIYRSYTMVYYYERGTVVKIEEIKGQHVTIIYEHKDTIGLMQLLFQKQEVEQEIEMIHDQINHLLDVRNMLHEREEHQQIDIRLSELTHRLFVLEA
ncbi:non-ribosomal peptide synthetase module [Paenibacillus roseipurpureus]|uniref:Non-ribosomal peptide synthetase module n=1 Tax=Paenibacillus roseopurpureus TaxID=2918901 RepID=A0AA96LTK9_9BACL|nr:non-ribosomal peptide synthetase module [Paenibacillus sp. MBLB1832]WNR45819.1 non-ribosomal peptide synthetase module [Paenibacillus sp. MBLB1832]